MTKIRHLNRYYSSQEIGGSNPLENGFSPDTFARLTGRFHMRGTYRILSSLSLVAYSKIKANPVKK